MSLSVFLGKRLLLPSVVGVAIKWVDEVANTSGDESVFVGK